MSDEKKTLITKQDLHKTAWRWMPMAINTFNYETQEAGSIVYALGPVLRKIYPNDDDYVEALNNHFKYFNTNPWMANIVFGAVIAMEEKEGLKAKDAIQSFKTGLMGPLAGVGDAIIWILIPTIMGSISGYMALQGNPIGAVMWMALNILFIWMRIKFFDLGYYQGTKLVTSMGDKLSSFTEAASVLGLTVVGALIATVVNVKIPFVYKIGKVSMGIQKDVLDKIMPALLPAVLAFLIYKLLGKKKMTTTKIILIVIVFSMVCAGFGILG